MFTPRGGLKKARDKPLGAITSSIEIGQGGFGNDHFTTSLMGDQRPVQSTQMRVSRRRAPDKNQDSEPGLWGSTADFPASHTFTTSSHLMNTEDKTGDHRQPAITALHSDLELGYKEAAAKNPWKTSAMQQFKDPLLGKRKKGPTAGPEPSWPKPKEPVNPFLGTVMKGKSNLFERYQPDENNHRITSDFVFKKKYNPSRTRYNMITHYNNNLRTNTFEHKVPSYPRPTLGTLGAIRP